MATAGNVRFITGTQNKGRRQSTVATVPTLKNGTGGAPVLIEDTQYPMANALFAGRTGRIWHCNVLQSAGNGPGSASDVVFDIDLGAPYSIAFGGLLGFSWDAGVTQPQNMTLLYQTGGSYNLTTGWVNALTVGASTQFGNCQTRDSGQFLDSPRTARYWRFTFLAAAAPSVCGFTVASFILANAVTDIGFLYAGASERLVRPRTLVEGYSRQPTITVVGDEYSLMELEYRNIDTATRDTFDLLYREPQPFIYVTPAGDVKECVFTDEQYERSHIFAPPDRWAFTVPLRALP